jgi:hypothetical protein
MQPAVHTKTAIFVMKTTDQRLNDKYISMRKYVLGYVSHFYYNILWTMTQSDKHYQNLTRKPSTLYLKETIAIYSPSYCIKHTWSESRDQHVAKDIFSLPGHSSKHYGTAVIYYNDCKFTNSPYFKEQMTKCMKIHKMLLKDCSLTVYMMTTNFENL